MIGISEGGNAPGVPAAQLPAAGHGARSHLPCADIDIAQLAEQVTTAYANYLAALHTNANVRQLSLLSFLD